MRRSIVYCTIHAVTEAGTPRCPDAQVRWLDLDTRQIKRHGNYILYMRLRPFPNCPWSILSYTHVVRTEAPNALIPNQWPLSVNCWRRRDIPTVSEFIVIVTRRLWLLAFIPGDSLPLHPGNGAPRVYCACLAAGGGRFAKGSV
jgi:hypothetical protein